MKWGRKKSAPPSSSPSPSSILNRVFPVSWFSKLKQEKTNPKSSSVKKGEGIPSELNFFPTPISSLPAGWREGRFYSMDEDDAYWRLSFGEERIQGRKSTGGINPLWYKDSGDHEFQVPASSFKSSCPRQMELPRSQECKNSFNDMVLDVRKMRERERKQKISRKLSPRVVREKHGELEIRPGDEEDNYLNLEERDIFPVEPENMVQMRDDSWKFAVSSSRKNKPIVETSERVSVSEWQNFEHKKFKEIKVKSTEPRESHSRRNNRAKAYSPRTECKIRALEEMKRARMKLKKKERKEQQVLEGKKAIFDSFAVVKSSFNPQQDFRESMVEMISEKGIGRPEELEELLACYLTLNCDEYHDLIIKVFRQVWLEMNGMYINGQCF